MAAPDRGAVPGRPQEAPAHGASGAPPPLCQLALFPGITGPRSEHRPRDDAATEPIAEAPSPATADRQLELFADRVVLFRELDTAIASGSFEQAAYLLGTIGESFGPDAARSLAPLERLAGVAWEGPPATPLSVWAEIDRQLAGQPHLRDRVLGGVFARLLQSHTPGELLAARLECLPVLARVVSSSPNRSPEEGRREARALVRDSLLAGRALEALDFRDDEALADLLSEDLSPRWLACLGRIRRLWPSCPPRASEWAALAEIARGATADEDPAMAFWQCLRLAESPDCAEQLRQQARRRMRQLHPELHVVFMRHEART